MNFFANGGSNGCGCNSCDIILLLLLLNGCGNNGCGGFGLTNSCDLVWLILILSCLCGGNCCK
ncbi:MAG: hypothetical protein NC037_00570 [Bacteroides sp.]|nr:hypothetical protein [Bacillota bacterium]MCM1393570.1 hypothetical protein [[Eubacterium] siraeum]MCM1455011.1 hypothetical protein [Bacteroides sp.]